MKKKTSYSLIGLSILMIFVFLFTAVAQKKSIAVLTIKEGSFGIDEAKKIVVWNHSEFKNEQLDTEVQLHFGKDTFLLKTADKKIQLENSYNISKGATNYTLYATKLPIITIDSSQEIVNDPKHPCQFQYYDQDTLINSLAGIELRGNVSLKFPKKSYDLEFWKDSVSKDSRDLKFKELRKDDDWVLDGLYDEPLRIRSFLAQKLWLGAYTPHYLDKEVKAKSGVDAIYTEVFLGDRYIGLHYLSEQVDRKLLRLKKKENKNVYGELFKASYYKGAPDYKKAPKFDNAFPTWGGYEMKYPFEDYTAHWDDIHSFTDFVVHSDEETFTKEIASRFVIDNAIDYFLFINMVRATDNLGKNFYVARYTKGAPYFNVTWDLDGVFGTIIDGRKIATTDDILTNGLFDRLWNVNPDNYQEKVRKRWSALRADQWSTNNLITKITKRFQQFESRKIYEREALVWENTFTQENLAYMTSWLQRRLEFLDQHFGNN